MITKSNGECVGCDYEAFMAPPYTAFVCRLGHVSSWYDVRQLSAGAEILPDTWQGCETLYGAAQIMQMRGYIRTCVFKYEMPAISHLETVPVFLKNQPEGAECFR